jgi:orotidine 5'-phosphate decarboxylase subfamily 1
MKLSFTERAKHSTNVTAMRLLKLMDEKKTNLSVAADVITKNKLLEIANSVGPEICVLKTHIDIVEDYDDDLVIQLQRLSEKHEFLLFEDRKFADIGNTAMHQYQDGIYHIADWADITNAHTVPGPGVIEGLKQIGLRKGRGLLLLSEMSPSGNLATGDYTKKSISMAKEHTDFVIGFIGTQEIPDYAGFINFMPGVHLKSGGDKLKQVYRTPENLITKGAVDIIIVGRGIIEAEDMAEAAKEYKKAGWEAYQKRIMNHES